jgi:predicted RND superfamily exporter protein
VDFVLIILVVMALGSVVALAVVPPFLNKIEPSGRVNFFGIKFPFG